MKEKTWNTYEEVAQHLLNRFAETFGLGVVEGKQIVCGKSGTNWEIDARGLKIDNEGFVIVECRRYTTSRLNQESVGGLAYRIKDVDADGGIIVSPLSLQKGAEIVASHEGIKHVILDPNSSTSEYMLKFLNQIFIGATDHTTATDRVRIRRSIGREQAIDDKP
jgi:hypothetical protein